MPSPAASPFDRLAAEPGAVRLAVRGVPVIVHNTRPDVSTEQALARLGEALDLIARYSPGRFRRLQRDLAGIWVQRFACRGAYFPAERACLTELTFLVHPEITAAQVAASILHEATHARVAQSAVGSCANRAAREERICRRVELEFGRAVPGGEQVVTRALESLTLADVEVAPAIDWTEAERRVSQVDRATESERSRPER